MLLSTMPLGLVLNGFVGGSRVQRIGNVPRADVETEVNTL